MRNILIFGINDLAEIMFYSLCRFKKKLQSEVIGFVVDDDFFQEKYFCNKMVYKYSELKSIYGIDGVEILIAIGYSEMNQNRKCVFDRLLRDGWKIGNYIDPHSDVRGQLAGIGNIVLARASIDVGCVVGNGNIFFTDCTIGHHSIIGDFNFFAIRSSVAGRVNIGNLCFFGNNCCTRDHISIDNQTLVGAGCYIDSDTVFSGRIVVPSRCMWLNKKSIEVNL